MILDRLRLRSRKIYQHAEGILSVLTDIVFITEAPTKNRSIMAISATPRNYKAVRFSRILKPSTTVNAYFVWSRPSPSPTEGRRRRQSKPGHTSVAVPEPSLTGARDRHPHGPRHRLVLQARAQSGAENLSARLRDYEVNPHVDARDLPGNQDVENCLLSIRLRG